MADKKPHRQLPTNPSKNVKSKPPLDLCPGLVTPSQLIPCNPHQTTTVKPSSSKMTSLGKLVSQQRPSFNSALISDYDPFAKRSLPLVSSNFEKTPPTPYVPTYAQKLFHIEHHHRHLTNPLHWIKANFPTNLHFSPSEPKKNLDYYSEILIQEGSINVITIYDQYNDGKVLYHKIEIIKFTSQKSWGAHPQMLKPLKGHLIQYSYYDDIQAWSKVLLHQNPAVTHSWFIAWHKNFKFIKSECQIPMWFLKWWSQHGPLTEILPPALNDKMLYFATMSKVTEYNSNFMVTLLFFAK